MCSVYVTRKLGNIQFADQITQGIEEIEEWNEYDELHEALGVDTAFTANPPKPTSLFEPAPSKTPPPLAGALPGGFSFGEATGSPFGSLSGGSKAKENTPIASAEQNLAIRQMGAEAAKIAASKKPTPVKISTTNPLLTEKTNAQTPADVLSPKSTPLPKSPNAATTEKSESEGKKTELPDILSPRSIPLPQTPGLVPKLGQQKPVHTPPSMQDDAENPALSAGPIKTTQAKKESSKEEEEEEESEKESSGDTTPAEQAEKIQDQDPKDASKAGASVKEGEQEKGSSEEESEDSTEAGAKEKEKKMESKTTEAKGAAQPKQSSSEETSEETSGEEESSDKGAKKEDAKTDETKKTPTSDAKDASKAGESVLD
jgi:hypothetical protein